MTPTNQPDRSPAPGIIPEPAYVHHHDTPAAATERHREPSLKRRNPLRLLASKVMSALRGDETETPAASPPPFEWRALHRGSTRGGRRPL